MNFILREHFSFWDFMLFVFKGSLFPFDFKKEKITEVDLEQDMLNIFSQVLVEKHRSLQVKKKLEEIKDIEDVNLNIIRKMLPVLDSLDRLVSWGASQAQDNELLMNWIDAIKGVYKRIELNLKNIGLEEIDPTGSPVDLSFHEVILYQPTYDYDEGIVIEARRKGYRYKGKVLREAQVVVANNLSGKGDL